MPDTVILARVVQACDDPCQRTSMCTRWSDTVPTPTTLLVSGGVMPWSSMFIVTESGALQTLAALVRSGQLDLDLVRISSFAFADLPAAMERAARMRGLDCTVVRLAG